MGRHVIVHTITPVGGSLATLTLPSVVRVALR